ncbi:MAG TPA: hypothetical protein VJ574_04195, partial [Candidatus Bathyarchaeia archaeon]|nr:hypothetical protein [Candidatus Bathyarchaeia archaeon]
EEGDPRLTRGLLEMLILKEAGPLRESKGLAHLLRELQIIRNERLPKLFSPDSSGVENALQVMGMVDVAEFLARASLHRAESRGAHFRSDYPNQDDDNWLKNVIIAKEGDRLRITERDVVQ